MELILQDIEQYRPKVIKHFNKYPSASISAMFRDLRKSPRLSFFGDYPIMAFILEILSEVGIRVNRPRLLRATRQSNELRGRKAMIDALFNGEIAIRKKPQVVQKRLFDRKGIHTSSVQKIAYV